MKKEIYAESRENTEGRREIGRGGSLISETGRLRHLVGSLLLKGMKKEPGIDGILVTIGLCIIALLLCVVMKDSLQTFITTIIQAMTTEAQNILTGVTS